MEEMGETRSMSGQIPSDADEVRLRGGDGARPASDGLWGGTDPGTRSTGPQGKEHGSMATAQDQSMPVKFCILLPRTDYPRLAQSCMRIESYRTTTAEHDFMSRQINYDSISVAQSDKTVLKDRRGPCSRLVQPALNRTGASSSRPADGNGQTERGRRHRWSLFTV